MRRLPVYLVLDVSGSMSGEPIEAVKNGLQTLMSALRSDPQALETAYLSVITFGQSVQQIAPLMDISSFQEPNLQASGSTPMGEALELVAKCRDREVAKSTPEVKGDWKPMVFLMTDGEATDDFHRGVAEFKKRSWGVVVACAAGAGANSANLQQITESVVTLDTANSDALKAFFKWVSGSISSSSKSVGTTGKEVTGLDQLPPPPPEIKIAV